MPSDPKPSRSRKKAAKPPLSALDAEQQKLRDQQEALEAKIAALQQSIQEAPKKAAEQRRRQVEAVRAATPPRGSYIHGATLLDTRHVEAAAASGRTRPRNGRRKPVVLRNERTEGRKQTVALVILLALAICWALSHYLS